MSPIKISNLFMFNLDIKYEDEHVVIVNKPAGILSQKDISKDKAIVDYIQQYKGYEYLALLHRLDRPVSGLIMLAKHKRAARLFSKAIKEGKIYKKYYAVVFGIPKSKELKHFMLDGDNNTVSIYDNYIDGAKEIVLEYKVLSSMKCHDISYYKGSFSVLDVTTYTGRKHQIRAQLSHIGHPIVGDSKYFNNKDLESKMLKCNFLSKGEIALCAYYLKFKHPLFSGKEVIVEMAYPNYWLKIL